MNMHVAVPGTPQDTRARRLAVQARKRSRSLRRLRKLRTEAQDEIERLIAFLDRLEDCDTDGAVDDEPCDEDTDREPDLDDEEGHDDEPSLCGITANGIMARGIPDLEQQCEDEGEQDTGIGDIDGLNEQVGSQDWQPAVMA
jgi:hypothetical protein